MSREGRNVAIVFRAGVLLTLLACLALVVVLSALVARIDILPRRLGWGFLLARLLKQRCLRWVPDTTGLLHPKDANRLTRRVPPL